MVETACTRLRWFAPVCGGLVIFPSPAGPMSGVELVYDNGGFGLAPLQKPLNWMGVATRSQIRKKLCQLTDEFSGTND